MENIAHCISHSRKNEEFKRVAIEMVNSLAFLINVKNQTLALQNIKLSYRSKKIDNFNYYY